jgi:hypothetical protein
MRFQREVLSALVACLVLATAARGGMVEHMELEQLCDNAARIFRGTVVDLDKGTVTAGGGQVPTLVYTIRVAEQFKGDVPTSADGNLFFTFTTVDLALIEAPRLVVGQDYLLLTTAPSSVGLSSTVGLEQGAFKIYDQGGTEVAVNGLGNVGLAQGLRGAIPYRDLAERVRTLVTGGVR